MKRFALLSLAATMLVACNPNPAAPEVIGNLDGDWSDLGNIDVAIVGVTEDIATIYDDQFQAVDGNITQGYSVALPAQAADGIYQVVAFVDENDNSEYDLNEKVGDSGDKYLQFSQEDKDDGVSGWSSKEGLDGEPVNAAAFSDFDLERTDGGNPDAD